MDGSCASSHSSPNLNSLLLFISIILLSPKFSVAQSSSLCDTSGECGPFGICDPQQSPICTCLQGFYPRNSQEWNSGNWSSGCLRKVDLNCVQVGNNGSRSDDGFLTFEITMYTGSSERSFEIDEIQCGNRCLRNCSCLAYGFQADSGCMLWSGNLTDIQKFSSGSGSNIHIRVSNSELVSAQKKDSRKIKIIPVVVAVVAGFLIISICTYFSWRWLRGKKKTIQLGESNASGSVDTSVQHALSQVNIQDFPLFKLETLVNATNNFSEAKMLGKGGFGPVYKGELANGNEIAVKRLAQASGQGMQEFMNEVVLITKLQHRNLVRLLGCCVESKEMMLIYEYMPNKSLDVFLFNQSQEILDWRKRFNIIEGICRGLLYLHRDSRLKIIHRDLKPSNILLDNDWNPKISDFGMARIYGTKQDHVSTLRVVGTYGYMAPEYAIEGRFSEKSDVFSFGVLVLEIATGRRNTSFYHQDGHPNLTGYVWKLWTEDNVVASIDPRISSLDYRAEVIRCIHIALLCVQELPRDRPSVSAVLSMLSSEIADLPNPKRSAFTMRPTNSDVGATTSSQKSSASLNYVSITMVDGR